MSTNLILYSPIFLYQKIGENFQKKKKDENLVKFTLEKKRRIPNSFGRKKRQNVWNPILAFKYPQNVLQEGQ